MTSSSSALFFDLGDRLSSTGVVVVCRTSAAAAAHVRGIIETVLGLKTNDRHYISVIQPLANDAVDCYVLVSFPNPTEGNAWLASPDWTRARERLEEQLRDGLGTIVASSVIEPLHRPTAARHTPPRRKLAVVMWVSVYPTITLLIWLFWPMVAHLPMAVRTLILSLIMVPLMTWIIVPFITRWFTPWLAGGSFRSLLRGSEPM